MADPVRDFLMDANGDIAVVNGDFALVAGAAAVPQGIAIRLRMFAGAEVEGQPDQLEGGDCWMDQTQGVRWRDQILVKNANPLVVRELLREAILDTPDTVDAAAAQLIDEGDRQASVNFQVQSIYSANSIQGEVTIP